jgi:hypothetical protein
MLRYAKKVLVLSATLTAAMVVGLLAFSTSARADVACVTEDVFCLEKTSSPDPVTVGEPLTFTIRGYCINEAGCVLVSAYEGLTDTLPAGLEFVSATATGYTEYGIPQPTCSESAGTVTCTPVAFASNQPGQEMDVPFVATIEVIPTQCGTFTNTASMAFGLSVSETFTVVGCVPTTKAQCKNGGWRAFGYPDQGTCITAVNQNRR